MPDTQSCSSVSILQARRNATAREALLQEFGSQVTDVSLVYQWRQEGRIFSVSHRGETCFPGFQFDAVGRPRPVIAEVVRSLGHRGSEWELALWFVAETGWLGGQRPVDLLDRDPEAVIRAARQEAAELVF